MKQIDFKNFRLYTDIRKSDKIIGDAREDFANVLYMRLSGIKAHNLAFKIYRSDGAEKYSEEEIEMMVKASEAFCLPNFIDGLKEQIDNNDKNIQQ